jgi:hypothetical protein
MIVFYRDLKKVHVTLYTDENFYKTLYKHFFLVFKKGILVWLVKLPFANYKLKEFRASMTQFCYHKCHKVNPFL